MEKKPLLIIVDNHGNFKPIIDRMEYEKFQGEIVRTFNESDTIETIKKAGVKRTHIIITDSLIPSEHITIGDRAAGTQKMIEQAKVLNPMCKIIVLSVDFFELDKKFTKNEVEFIDSKKKASFDVLCEKIHTYAKVA